jgi:hypothetical protein
VLIVPAIVWVGRNLGTAQQYRRIATAEPEVAVEEIEMGDF